MRMENILRKRLVRAGVLHGNTKTVDGRVDPLYAASTWARSRQSEYEREQGFYHYIGMSVEGFLHYMNPVPDIAQRRFIDVGCGIGDKLIAARLLLGIKDVSGVEYNNATFGVAQKLAGKIANRLIHDDAFNVDFSTWDLIYMYHPMQNDTAQADLWRHCVRTMPEGGIIVEAMGCYISHIARTHPHLFHEAPDWSTSGIFLKHGGKLRAIRTR